MSRKPERAAIAGLILAGGRSTRMGGMDKGLLDIGGRTMIERVASRLTPQVSQLALNAPDASAGTLQLVPDLLPGRPGPLAGIAAGMVWAGGLPHVTHLATAACDTPFFPMDLVARLGHALRAGGAVAMARSAGGLHPTFALWPVSLADDLVAHLDAAMSGSVRDYAAGHGIAEVDFEVRSFDPFFNINTPQDLEKARSIAAELDE